MATRIITIDFYDMFSGDFLGTRLVTEKVNSKTRDVADKHFDQMWFAGVPIPDNITTESKELNDLVGRQ